MSRPLVHSAPGWRPPLLERLAEEVNRASRHGLPLALVVFRVNAAAAGSPPDAALRRAAMLVSRAVMRRSDVIGPLGTDEFGVVANATREGASILAASLQEHLEALEFALGGRPLELGLSWALACLSEGKRAEDLLAEARAMLEEPERQA